MFLLYIINTINNIIRRGQINSNVFYSIVNTCSSGLLPRCLRSCGLSVSSVLSAAGSSESASGDRDGWRVGKCGCEDVTGVNMGAGDSLEEVAIK